MTRWHILPLLLFAPWLASPPVHAQTIEHHEGTAPLSSSTKYRAHGEQDGVRIGAERLTRKQVSQTFAANLNRCCLVVQVGFYPKKDELTDLFLADFTLVDVATDTPVRPVSATVVAATLIKPQGSGGGPQVTPVASVGYENGTYIDPVTGQPVHVSGVSTGVGVAVSPGNSTPPEVTDRDRDFVERELYEKGLPEAKVSIPVAGYLYFPIAKSTKDTKYRLVYSGKSEPITLPLP